MTMRQKKSFAGLTVGVVLAGLMIVATGVAARSAMQPVRIEIMIEQMTFRTPDTANSSRMIDNPTLRVRTGQTVELVLRSIDPGMKHDLLIPDLDLRADAVANGETSTIRFTAPAPGTYTYLCSMHPKLMRGELIVTE
jgi:plastocyanin